MVFLANVWSVMLELGPWLLLGAAAAGLLHGLVPKGFIRRQLSGPSGVLKAVLLGVPLPLCSCGVIPAGIGLKEDGASDGAAVGFLTATPQTGVDSILVSASFLGWPFALSKVAAALVTGAAGGLLTDMAGGGRGLPQVVPAGASDGARPGAAAMVAHGVEMIRMIWRWLVFGILVSAALTTFLPPDVFASMATQATVVAFGVVLLASVPLYVCATASVPIAAALVAAGMPTGAAMVFLMAGPATNVATIGAVYRAFNARVLAIYLLNIIAGSVIFGLAYELFFGDVVVGAAHAHAHTAWWSQAGAVVLSAMIGWFALEDLRPLLARLRPAGAGSGEIVVGVEGMTCGGCSSRLERTLLKAEGVETAAVSLDEKRAVVTGAISEAAVREVIEAAGFDPVGAVA